MRAAPDGDPAECTEEHGHIDARREREIPLPALIDRVRRRRSQDSNPNPGNHQGPAGVSGCWVDRGITSPRPHPRRFRY